MKFNTKLWKRSKKSFATTIPHVVLFKIDENKKYNIEWEFNSKVNEWVMRLKEVKK